MDKSRSQYSLAVGLGYEPGGEEAPKVLIKGDHLDADQIVKTAKRFGVPVVDHPSLADALSQIELDHEISSDLFHAVAVVLNSLDEAQTEMGNRHSLTSPRGEE